jgi:hypothetical protein
VARQFLKIKGVQRLAQLMQNVICYVGDIVYWSLANGRETLRQPGGRRPDCHTPRKSSRVTGTKIQIFYFNCGKAFSATFGLRLFSYRQMNLTGFDYGNFPRNTNVREAVRTI